jgi:hypothetical protein
VCHCEECCYQTHRIGEEAKFSPIDTFTVTHLHVRLLCVSKRPLAFSLRLEACPTTRVLTATTNAFHEEGSTYLTPARSQRRSRRANITGWLTTRQTTQMVPAYSKPAVPEHAYRQTLTKHRTLDINGIETACPLDNGKHKFKRHTHDLGVLDGLPDELLLMALVVLDIRTLTDFRRVNKRAMEIVNSVSQYKLVMNTCLALPRSLLSTGLGSQFSIHDLAVTLTGYKCATCGDFAGYTNILTCKRVCHLCFFYERQYYPLTASEAERRFGVRRGFFASLPSLKILPGTYTCRGTPCKTRLTLYDLETARRMSIGYHGSSQAMEAHVAEHTQKGLEAYQQRLALHNNSGYRGARPRGPPRAGLEDGPKHEARPYMAIVVYHGSRSSRGLSLLWSGDSIVGGARGNTAVLQVNIS